MPVDVESLAALRDLTNPPGPSRPWLAWRPSAPSRRVTALGVGSVVAGVLCGLLLPGPAEAGTPYRGASARSTSTAAFRPAGYVPSFTPVLLAGTASLSSIVAPVASRAVSSVAPSAAPAYLVGGGSTGTPGPGRLAPVAVIAAPAPTATPPSPTYRPRRPLPSHSGTGRRIVYAERSAHVWIVGADGVVLRDYPVTGRIGRPKPRTYHIYSKSRTAYNPAEKLRFDLMVRFAYGLTGARIGFHTIPRHLNGVPIQSESQLGQAIGAGGCVRQSRVDATWLYSWSHVGDTVVVLA